MQKEKQGDLLDSIDYSTIVETNEDAKDGQNKCPKCGSTDISLNIHSGRLRCNFCRFELEPQPLDDFAEDFNHLRGKKISSGAKNIKKDDHQVITLKCSSCGSEVVIDTTSQVQARCHWCRSILSINHQVPNGIVPDAVLPFQVSKEEAKKQIEKFVGKRRFFANPQFKKEFTTQNIMGVYFPYMVVDMNSHANFSGQGEKLIRQYTRGNERNRQTYYDADLYHLEREFDLKIQGLTLESSKDRLNKNAVDKTNNVINAIMPFDTEKCVKWDANYLRGYTSEKRDINIEQLESIVEEQSKDIARFSANTTLEEYTRGVCWSKEEFSIQGQRWKSAYLPVWLYSYQQIKGKQKILHYVAVNARTKETMGSIPIHMSKLLFCSFFIEILGILAMFFVDFDYSWLFLFVGFFYYFFMYMKYRNRNARHQYEIETKTNVEHVRKVDQFLQRKTGLTNSKMIGANNTCLHGENLKKGILDILE